MGGQADFGSPKDKEVMEVANISSKRCILVTFLLLIVEVDDRIFESSQASAAQKKRRLVPPSIKEFDQSRD